MLLFHQYCSRHFRARYRSPQLGSYAWSCEAYGRFGFQARTGDSCTVRPGAYIMDGCCVPIAAIVPYAHRLDYL